jgi:hypothetical protein
MVPFCCLKGKKDISQKPNRNYEIMHALSNIRSSKPVSIFQTLTVPSEEHVKNEP